LLSYFKYVYMNNCYYRFKVFIVVVTIGVTEKVRLFNIFSN